LNAARLQAELNGTRPSYAGRAGGDDSAAVDLQEALRLTRQQAHADRMASLQTRLREKVAQEAAASALLDKRKAVQRIAQEKEKRLHEMLNENFISRVEYLQHQQAWVEAENDVKVQARELEQAARPPWKPVRRSCWPRPNASPNCSRS
jgi:prophage DNA circulation protein